MAGLRKTTIREMPYVDWLGIDGYNWASRAADQTWRTPAQVFDAMLARLRALADKPVAINEVATQTNAGANLVEKNSWIQLLFALSEPKQYRHALLASGEDKEYDWAIFACSYGDEAVATGEKGYSAYRTAVQSDRLIPADKRQPRGC